MFYYIQTTDRDEYGRAGFFPQCSILVLNNILVLKKSKQTCSYFHACKQWSKRRQLKTGLNKSCINYTSCVTIIKEQIYSMLEFDPG